MKFKKVTLHAFRAYKDKEFGTFDFTLSNEKIANFISIYAPNGFGKTSFYDGVEWGMTGSIRRFKKFADEAKAEKGVSLDKQFILQHQGTNISSNRGFVNIETTKDNFNKEIKQISTSSTADYVYNKRKFNNDFFQNVLLSQDGIDDFLKAENNQERYDKFSSSFIDENTKDYHENIVKLEERNNKEKNKIHQKILIIEEELEEQIDSEIFSFVNKNIDLLNNNKIIKIDDSFSETRKIELDNQLTQQKIELSKKVDYSKSINDKLPSWIQDSEKYFKYKVDWETLKEKLKDYEELNNANSKIIFLNKDINKHKESKQKFEILIKSYPRYKSTLSDIKKKEQEVKELKQKKSTTQKASNEGKNEFDKLSKKIDFLENNKKEIIDKLEKIPKIYEDIKSIELSTDDKQKNLQISQEQIQNHHKKIELLEDSQRKTLLIKEAIQNNIFIDIDSDDNYKTEVLQIESLLKEIEENKILFTKIKLEQKEYAQYNKQLKELLSVGIGIIDKEQNNTCPLCNVKQDSYDALKAKVLNNDFLNKVEKELLRDEKNLNHSIQVANKKIHTTRELIILDFDKKLVDIKNDLIDLNHKINKIDLTQLQESIKENETKLIALTKKTENKKQDEFVSIKEREQKELQKGLDKLSQEKKDLDVLNKKIDEEIELTNISINNNEKTIDEFKIKQEYQNVNKWIMTFEQNIDILKQLDLEIELIDTLITNNQDNLKVYNDIYKKLTEKYNVINLDNLTKIIKELEDEVFQLYTKEIFVFESAYEQYFKNKIETKVTVKSDVEKKQKELEKLLKDDNSQLEIIELLEKSTDNLLKFIENKKKEKELELLSEEMILKEKVSEKLTKEKNKVEDKINKDVKAFFYEDLINQIYEKIDPHPDYKRVRFECNFKDGVGKLNIFVNDNTNFKSISPSLYYSTAQLNVLSLSIFLAKALHVKDDFGNDVDCIFIDDPIQSMDSINILATIDLLRSLVVNYNKQIILSTHDENFHNLLQKKIPKNYFSSKFIELESFGKVKEQI